jgi:hypothetical protein
MKENKHLKRLHNEVKIAVTKQIVGMRNFNLNTEKSSDYHNDFSSEFSARSVEINMQICALVQEVLPLMKQGQINKIESLRFVQLIMRLSSSLNNHSSFYRNPINS